MSGTTSWTGGLSHGCAAVFRNDESGEQKRRPIIASIHFSGKCKGLIALFRRDNSFPLPCEQVLLVIACPKEKRLTLFYYFWIVEGVKLRNP